VITFSIFKRYIHKCSTRFNQTPCRYYVPLILALSYDIILFISTIYYPRFGLHIDYQFKQVNASATYHTRKFRVHSGYNTYNIAVPTQNAVVRPLLGYCYRYLYTLRRHVFLQNESNWIATLNLSLQTVTKSDTFTIIGSQVGSIHTDNIIS